MLVTSKNKRKRSRAMTIMLLPVLILMFIIGWCMYWAGNQKRTNKTQRKPPKEDNVTIMPIILEETEEIPNE